MSELDQAISKLQEIASQPCACSPDVKVEICGPCKARVIVERIIRIIADGL